MELIKFCSDYSVVQCVYESKNQLSKIKREEGEKEALRQIIYLVNWANSAFKNNLSDDMVFEVSLSILKEYWFFKLEDIALFCSMLRRGDLVKVYNLEMQTFFEALRIYDQRRADAIHKKHIGNKEIFDYPRQPELSETQKLSAIIKNIDK